MNPHLFYLINPRPLKLFSWKTEFFIQCVMLWKILTSKKRHCYYNISWVTIRLGDSILLWMLVRHWATVFHLNIGDLSFSHCNTTCALRLGLHDDYLFIISPFMHKCNELSPIELKVKVTSCVKQSIFTKVLAKGTLSNLVIKLLVIFITFITNDLWHC